MAVTTKEQTRPKRKRRNYGHRDQQRLQHLWVVGAIIVVVYSFLAYQYYQQYWVYSSSPLWDEEKEQSGQPLCLQVLSHLQTNTTLQPQARVLLLFGETHTPSFLHSIHHRFEAVLLLQGDSHSNNQTYSSNVFLMDNKALLLEHTLFVSFLPSSIEALLDTLDMLEDGQRVVMLSTTLPAFTPPLQHLLQLNQDIISLWIYGDSSGSSRIQEQGVLFVSPSPVEDTVYCL